MDWGAIANVAGTLIGGMLGNEGAEDTNNANRMMSAEQMAFNRNEAAKNRMFQDVQARRQMTFQRQTTARKMKYDTRMADTAVSRRMADLRRSGINPILAGRYDADTPSAAALSGASGSGSQASSYSIIPAVNEMAPLASSAKSLLPDLVALQRALVDTENAKKSGELIDAQVASAKEDPRQKRLTQEKTVKEMQKLETEAEEIRRRLPKIDSETERTKAETRLRNIEATLKSKDVPMAEMKNKAMTSIQSLIDTLVDKMTPSITSTAKDVQDTISNRVKKSTAEHKK